MGEASSAVQKLPRSLVPAAFDPLCHAIFMNDRGPTIAVAPNNNVITIACVVMPPISVMIPNADANANRSNADISIFSMCR
jgi:hypothetical protein